MVLLEKCSSFITVCIQRGVKEKSMYESCSWLFPPAWLLLRMLWHGYHGHKRQWKKHQGLWANPSVSSSSSTHPALKCLCHLLSALQVTRMARQNVTKRGKSTKGVKGKVHGRCLCSYIKWWSALEKDLSWLKQTCNTFRMMVHCHCNVFLVAVCLPTKSQCESWQYLSPKEQQTKTLMEIVAMIELSLSSPLQCNVQPFSLT